MDDDNRPGRQPDGTLTIPFTGGASRSAPLTVGQANMRRCVLRDDPASLNACLVLPLPDGTTLDAVAGAVRTLALRHESLRTRYPVDPELRQVVASEGEFTLRVTEAVGDPGAYARQVGVRLRAARFDPVRELPMRPAVVTAGDRPTFLVLVVCHIAVDAAALDLLTGEWHAALAGRELPPAPAVQPVDLALTEQSVTGARRLSSSLRYWEDVLRSTPQSMFAVPGVDSCDWQLPRLRIRSRAAAPALAAAAARTQASPATLVLAALCALLGRHLDQRTLVLATPAANRFLPELAPYVGTVAQDGLMSVELAGVSSFDELAVRVRGRALAALRRSWFDYEELLPVIQRVERERGSHWARDCVFNDLTALDLAGLLTSPPVPTGGERGTDAGRGTGERRTAGTHDRAVPDPDPEDPDLQLDWFVAETMLTRLMLWAVRLEDEVELVLWADPRLLSRHETAELGGGIVRLLRAAADGDVSLDRLGTFAGLTPVVRGEGWYESDRCQVELAAVQALLEEAGGVPCLVTAVPDERLGHRLEAYLAGPADPATIHTACLAGLRHRRLHALAPHHYTVVDGAPDDRGDPGAWRARPVLGAGTGRDHTPAGAAR